MGVLHLGLKIAEWLRTRWTHGDADVLGSGLFVVGRGA